MIKIIEVHQIFYDMNNLHQITLLALLNIKVILVV